MRFRLALHALALLGLGGALLTPLARAEEETVAAQDAHLHVGRQVTVCGSVAATAYFAHLRGEPTFLNLEKPYPDQPFTVVIWGQYRGQFPRSPDQLYRDQVICVTGNVELFRGKPQIQVRSPSQIRITEPRLDVHRFSPEERVLIKAMLAFLGHGTEYDTAEWDADADEAMREFQTVQGVADDSEAWPRTLRALAESADELSEEQRLQLVRLLLLNLAQREAAASAE
jgi:hypothetical protein